MAFHKLSRTLVLVSIALLALAGAAARASVSVDFRQDANDDSGFSLGEAHWINSIVQSSNAVYFEGMGLSQRVILKDLPGTNAAGTQHSLTFSHQWTKGGVHAFDWLMSWPQAEATGTAELSTFLNAVILQKVLPFMNGNEIAASILPVSVALTSGPNVLDVTVPDDAFQSANGSVPVPPAQRVPVQPRIDDFEAAYGNRTIRIWADAPISNAALTLSHSVPNGGDTGDSFMNYTLTWTTATKSTQAVIWMAAHIAVGNDSPTLINLVPGGWGLNKGASQINGGPYHFSLDRADGVQLGSQDNQLKGSSVRSLPECNLSGPTSVCPNSTNTYTTSSNDPAATFVWSLQNANGASFVGGTTGASVQVTAGGCATSYRLCVTVTDSTGLSNTCCTDVSASDTTPPTVTKGSIGTCYKTQAEAEAAAVTATSVSDNCGGTVTKTVSTSGTCSAVITVTGTDPCGNKASVTYNTRIDNTAPTFDNFPPDANYQCIGDVPALADLAATDNCDGALVAKGTETQTGTSCDLTIKRTWTVQDDCGNSTSKTQTITVKDTTPPSLTCATTARVTFPDPVVDSNNCGGATTRAFTRSDGKLETDPYPIGTSVDVTITITDACGNSASCRYNVNITAK